MLELIIGVLFSVGAIDSLIPLIIIVILIVAAAGATRGFSIFNVFGIATLAGIGAGRASIQGRTALGRFFYLSQRPGSSDIKFTGSRKRVMARVKGRIKKGVKIGSHQIPGTDYMKDKAKAMAKGKMSDDDKSRSGRFVRMVVGGEGSRRRAAGAAAWAVVKPEGGSVSRKVTRKLARWVVPLWGAGKAGRRAYKAYRGARNKGKGGPTAPAVGASAAAAAGAAGAGKGKRGKGKKGKKSEKPKASAEQVRNAVNQATQPRAVFVPPSMTAKRRQLEEEYKDKPKDAEYSRRSAELDKKLTIDSEHKSRAGSRWHTFNPSSRKRKEARGIRYVRRYARRAKRRQEKGRRERDWTPPHAAPKDDSVPTVKNPKTMDDLINARNAWKSDPKNQELKDEYDRVKREVAEGYRTRTKSRKFLESQRGAAGAVKDWYKRGRERKKGKKEGNEKEEERKSEEKAKETDQEMTREEHRQQDERENAEKRRGEEGHESESERRRDGAEHTEGEEHDREERHEDEDHKDDEHES